MIDRGLDAIEVYHSDHSVEDVTVYRGMAIRFNALTSGGSDFHGEDPAAHGDKPHRMQRSTLGTVTLPTDDLSALETRVRLRRRFDDTGL